MHSRSSDDHASRQGYRQGGRVITASGAFFGILYGVHFREGDDGMMDGVEYVDVLQRLPDGSSIEHNHLAPNLVAFVDPHITPEQVYFVDDDD
jgi:hypothetical protein